MAKKGTLESVIIAKELERKIGRHKKNMNKSESVVLSLTLVRGDKLSAP